MKTTYFILFFFLFVSFVFSQKIKIKEEENLDYDTALRAGPPPSPKPVVNNNKIFTHVDQEAEFNYGFGKFKDVSELIAGYLEYTVVALDNGTEGVVVVRFVVEIDGSVSDVQVEGDKLGDGLDEVAINAIKRTSHKWIPAKVDGQFVRSYYQVPVTFRLPQE